MSSFNVLPDVSEHAAIYMFWLVTFDYNKKAAVKAIATKLSLIDIEPP